MRSLTTFDSQLADLFREFNRFTVGFEPTFKMLDQVRTTSNSGYPPYDLEQIDEMHYRLSMAVAGFSADDIQITLQDNTLTIDGKINREDTRNYLYKGIATRSFHRVFYINNYVKVTGSNLVDGVLTIDFEQEVPESMKPKTIPITSGRPVTAGRPVGLNDSTENT